MGWKSNSNQAGDDEYPSLENRPEIALAIRKLDLEANRIGIEYRAAIIKMLSPDANLSDIDAAKQLAKLYQRATAEAASVRTSVTSDSATHELAALYRNAAKRAQSPEASQSDLDIALRLAETYYIAAKRAVDVEGKPSTSNVEIPRCRRSIGNVALIGSSAKEDPEIEFGNPTSLLQVLIKRSGCFTLADDPSAMKNSKGSADYYESQRIDYYIQPEILEYPRDTTQNAEAMQRILGSCAACVFMMSEGSQPSGVSLLVVDGQTRKQLALFNSPVDWTKVEEINSTWTVNLGDVGSKYLSSERGQLMILAYVDAFSKMVNKMGGMNSSSSAQNQQARLRAMQQQQRVMQQQQYRTREQARLRARQQQQSRARPRLGAVEPGTEDPDHETSFIPWPPPRPSTMEEITSNFRMSAQYGGINSQLRALLKHKGYNRQNYFKVPGGFGVTTEVERLRDDGQPHERRWTSTRIPSSGGFYDFIKTIFMGDTGHFRLLVFVVSDRHPMPTTEEADQSNIKDWTKTGRAMLSEGAARAETNENTRVWLLVYEFVSSNSKSGDLISSGKNSFSFDIHAKYLGLK